MPEVINDRTGKLKSTIRGIYKKALINKNMSAIKASVILCKHCNRKYVNLETQGNVCDSCQQYLMTEANLEGAIRQARLETGGLTLQRIAKILHEVLKDDTKGLLKELMKYKI